MFESIDDSVVMVHLCMFRLQLVAMVLQFEQGKDV